MGTILIFALVLAATGGLTAYIGDRLGTYIGKKRKSIAGLRPRHTAMLGTVVTGGLIAAGTLLILLGLNATVRRALRHGPQLVHDNYMLNRQNEALTRHALALMAQAQSNEAKAAQAQTKTDAAQTKTAQAQAKADQAQAKADAAQAKVVEAAGRLKAVQTSLTQTQAKLAQTQGQVQTAQNKARQAQNAASRANNEVARAQGTVLRLSKTSDELRARNIQLAQDNKAKQTALNSSQGGNVIYRKGEEVGRTIIAAGQPVSALRREILSFLDTLDRAAREKGGGSGGGKRAVIVVPPARRPGLAPVRSEDAALKALAQNLAVQSGSSPSVVLVAKARLNTVKGEPTKLDLLPYDNVLVFRKGVALAAAPVDGTQPEDVILKQLQTFLIQRVRPVALRHGIIPTRDPQTGEPSVGQPIDSATWVALVKQIQSIGPNARIVASVADDTYSGDLLRLELHPTASPNSQITGAGGNL